MVLLFDTHELEQAVAYILTDGIRKLLPVLLLRSFDGRSKLGVVLVSQNFLDFRFEIGGDDEPVFFLGLVEVVVGEAELSQELVGLADTSFVSLF